MRALATLLLVISAVLTPAAGQEIPGCETEAKAQARPAAEVVGALDAYYRDFSARDWDRFASHFWDGATLTTVWQPPEEDSVRVVVTTVPEYVEQAPAGPGSREIFEERMLCADVRISGNLAQVWARYRARFGDPGQLMEWEGTDAFTLMEHGGTWKIVALAFATDADPPAENAAP